MKGDPVPDADHVSRLCGGSHIDDGVVQAGAFLLAPGHAFLSVNWLEHLGLNDRAAEVVQRVLATKRKVGATARLAVAVVGEIRTLVRNESDDARVLRVLHEPEETPPDPSHAGIHNLRHDGLAIAVLLSRAFSELHPSRATVSGQPRDLRPAGK
jgi:hypothetical protein